ncbi:MAG: hypothetical protein IJL02_11410 [Methanobrevibacter sp.]|uniref:hypothetical protein n=1 Tax=Methanobrevibacter sp. TaxID=66852 RepID=UPI0025E7BAF7|nr:hypothetical protein [Methanobrevibacter sp.]MBQ6100453.1 hypothetical protein [Methanobrevibacter sp.]
MNFYLGYLQFAIEIVIFLVLMFVGIAILNRLKDSKLKIFHAKEYFPEEEVHSLRQMYYLVMMALFFINILYFLIFDDGNIIYFAIFDIFLSLYLAITLDKSSIKNKILLIFLIPFSSMTFTIFGLNLVGLLDLIHIPIFIYFMKVYFDEFRTYTKSNGLGITVILLFTIIFVSFLITQVVESVNPLDSLVMVSNAFTSNGYTVLGQSIPGKINSIFLVWGGYILSGVGTATLASAILIRHFNKKIDKYDERLDRLEELIKKNNED